MRYHLEVIAHGKPGYYEADSLFYLFWGVFVHRTQHLLKHGKWMD